MGDTFQGINGNFHGFALENSDFNPVSDDSNMKNFFDGDNDFGEQPQAFRKSPPPFRKTRKRKRKSARKSVQPVRRSEAGFGGITGGF